MRDSNIRVDGDESAWTVVSCSDGSGLGAVRVLFPKPRDKESGNKLNGLFHESNRPDLVGMHTTISCFNGYVRFHPGATIDFFAFTPVERWSGALFINFSGPPNSCFTFSFYRHVIWRGTPPPYVPPENAPEHDEL